MRRFFYSIATALSLIPLGEPIILKSVLVSSSAVVISSTQKVFAEDGDSYLSSGREKHLNGNYIGAIKALSKAILIEPENIEAYRWRSFARYVVKDYEGAIFDLNKVLEINPEDADAYSVISDSKFMLKDYKSAIEYASKAINIDPDYDYAYFARAQAKYLLDDLNGACFDWEKSSSLGNEDATNWVRDLCSD